MFESASESLLLRDYKLFSASVCSMEKFSNILYYEKKLVHARSRNVLQASNFQRHPKLPQDGSDKNRIAIKFS